MGKGYEIEGATPNGVAPFLVWLQEEINHTQGRILDYIELSFTERIPAEVLSILRAKIKRELQDLNRDSMREFSSKTIMYGGQE